MERTEKEKTDVILYSNDGLKELNGGKLEGKARLKRFICTTFFFQNCTCYITHFAMKIFFLLVDKHQNCGLLKSNYLS